MTNKITPISFSGRYNPKTTLKKVIKSYYNAAKPLDLAPKGAPKLPLMTRIKKFFTSLANANKNYYND